MKKFVIIVAGGKGTRFKNEIPKQFLEIAGTPMLMRTIKAFYHYDTAIEIILVLPSAQVEFWQALCNKHHFYSSYQIIEGGRERFHSVQNGLNLIPTGALVAIHDGARPLIDKKTIENCFKIAETEGNAIPVIDLTDSIREVQTNGQSLHVDRRKYKLIQTPQVFQSTLIKMAYEKGYSKNFTDDASVLESLIPGCIKLVEGNKQNIKITNPEDMYFAEAILRARID